MSTITSEAMLTDGLLFRQACYIGGAWVEARGGERIGVDNPATGEIIGAVPGLGAAETRHAIDSAARAFPVWRKRTARERAAVLRRWFELVMSNQEDLARLMTLEQGKPLAESRGEVAYAASFLEWFGEEAKRDLALEPEFAGRVEAGFQLVVELQVDIHLLVAGAVERPGSRIRQSARRVDSAGEEHELGLAIRLAQALEQVAPDVLGLGEYVLDEPDLAGLFGALLDRCLNAGRGVVLHLLEQGCRRRRRA